MSIGTRAPETGDPASRSDDRTIPAARALAPEALGHLPRDGVVLDVREADAFARGHLEGSGHVPYAELKPRRAELPPRNVPVVVVAESALAAARGAEALRTHGFEEVLWLDAPLATVENGLASYAPAATLWRPAPFLEAVLPRLARGRAADLAAGSGREAVFMALHGFEVEAWDASSEALERARALAERHGVALDTVRCDLEAVDPPLAASRYDLIVCFRFLHRPLFPRIERALRPGGHLVYETYRAGQERFGKPRRARFLLAPGELRDGFPGLQVLHYEERDPPGGPLTARLLARRPHPSDSGPRT